MPILIIEHSRRPGGTGILGTTLREYGHRATVVQVAPASGPAHTLPQDLDDVDALVLSDGPQTLASAWSTLDAERELVRQAHGRRLPIVGLGLGARILAQALGGEVTAGPASGWLTLRLTFAGHEDPLYAGIPWTYRQPFHQAESIAKLPEGATALAHAATEGGKPQVRAFTAGVFAYGFEHLWWLDGGRVEGASDVRAAWDIEGDRSMRLGRRMAESVALHLMPIDRMNRGRVKDLHY